jgi:hypothetical protein
LHALARDIVPRGLQSRLAAKPMRTVGPHHVRFAGEEDPDPAVTVSQVLRRELALRPATGASFAAKRER